MAALWAAVEQGAPHAAVMTAAATVVPLARRPRSPCGLRSRTGTPRSGCSCRCLASRRRWTLRAGQAGPGRGLPALARRKVGVKPLLPREVDDKLASLCMVGGETSVP